MSKFARFLVLLFAAVAVMPLAAKADDSHPISIKSASVETQSGIVVGQVELCNGAKENVRLTLEAKNLTINSLYKRNLMVPAGECKQMDLHFTQGFAQMSNVGDSIRFLAKEVRGMGAMDTYLSSDSFVVKVTKGDADTANTCADQTGKDDVYTACIGGFIYHTPSGLRIKVMSVDWQYIALKLTHVEWGGVQDVKIYKGQTKKFRSNYDELERVQITNVYGDKTSAGPLKIESLD